VGARVVNGVGVGNRTSVGLALGVRACLKSPGS
jgi:hypothetical protein